MIINLVKKHIPIQFTFQGRNNTIFVSKQSPRFYININSLSDQNTTISRWKRGKDVCNLIKRLDKSEQNFKSYLSSRSYGTWVSMDLFESFGNWLHTRSLQPRGFGTYVRNNIDKLYNKFKPSKFFALFNSLHIRASENTRFINITDITQLYETDIRTWKKNQRYKNYIKDKPNHYVSGNKITDSLGLKITYCHPNLALLITKCINKIHPNKHFKNIIKFINFHKIALEEDEEEKIVLKPNKKILDNTIEYEEKKDTDNPVQKLNLFNLSPEDFAGVRITPDGLFSVYDCIAKFKGCSTKRAQESFVNLNVSENPRNIQVYKFSGRGQRNTPVCTFHELLQILSQLPGKQAKILRKEQAEISTRAIAGDEDLEKAVREQRDGVSDRDQEVLMRGLGRKSRFDKLSIDTRPYAVKDVVYTLEFVPTENGEIEEGRRCYNFGVTSNIDKRLNSHRSDHEFGRVRLDQCFVYENRYEASLGEKRIKELISDLGLEMVYFRKKECFMATDTELVKIYEEMKKYTKGSLRNTNRDDITLLKLRMKNKILTWFTDGMIGIIDMKELLQLI